MNIPPSHSLLQALSNTSTQPANSAARTQRATTPDAAREAARAVFAQFKSPVPGTPAPSAAAQSQSPAPSIPTTQPRRPMPRGSIVNILV